MKYLTNIGHVALRELDILRKNRIYGFCMIVFPLLLVVFFTTMLDDGVAIDLPVGVVDQDNSATSRGLIRNLDAMQSSRVVYRFANVTEARNAMQEGKVYAYLNIPEGTSAKLLAGRQPKISYYYTMTCMTAGSMAMKDMKTIGTLGSAAVGRATLSAKGASKEQIKSVDQYVDGLKCDIRNQAEISRFWIGKSEKLEETIKEKDDKIFELQAKQQKLERIINLLPPELLDQLDAIERARRKEAKRNDWIR